MIWEKVRLGDICEVYGGTTPSTTKEDFWNGDVVWLSPTDLPEIGEVVHVNNSIKKITSQAVKESSLTIVPPGTVVYSTRASIGKIGIAEVPLTTNQGFANFVCNGKIFNKYLAYALKFYTRNISKLSNSTTFAEVSRTAIRNFCIPLPSYPTQQKIATILEKADSLRRKDQLLLASYDKLRQSIFYQMFGDPVKNEKGWEEKKFGNIYRSIRYGTSTPPIYQESGIPFIRATNVKQGRIIKKDLVFVSANDASKISKCYIKEGDLLLVRSGINTGDCARVNSEYNKSLAGYDLIIEIDEPYSTFYNYLINSNYGKSIIKPLSRRAAQPHLNAEQTGNLKFIFPPIKLQKKFSNIYFNIELAIELVNKQRAFSGSLFQSLLQKAFKGELVN